MRRQKGQALVEFAFVLPILLMIVFMILYGGMMFADYLTYCGHISAKRTVM